MLDSLRLSFSNWGIHTSGIMRLCNNSLSHRKHSACSHEIKVIGTIKE